MSEAAIEPQARSPVEAVLRDELAHGDTVIGTIAPILGHLLASQGGAMFSDEIVARLRGMLSHIAHQLLLAQAEALGQEDPRDYAADHLDPLVDRFSQHSGLLTHCHALAVEAQLTTRHSTRNGIDPVLSPLLQALIASDDAATAATAMAALASQARFVQAQRRMDLALHELTGELFHEVLLVWRAFARDESREAIATADATLRQGYDETRSRLGLLDRLVAGMGPGARAALSLGHAGAPLFLTALAHFSRQPRDLAVISTGDRQLARLALSLRAAGLKPEAVEEQFIFIHPDVGLPEGFETLRIDSAAAMLADSSVGLAA